MKKTEKEKKSPRFDATRIAAAVLAVVLVGALLISLVGGALMGMF